MKITYLSSCKSGGAEPTLKFVVLHKTDMEVSSI